MSFYDWKWDDLAILYGKTGSGSSFGALQAARDFAVAQANTWEHPVYVFVDENTPQFVVERMREHFPEVFTSACAPVKVFQAPTALLSPKEVLFDALVRSACAGLATPSLCIFDCHMTQIVKKTLVSQSSVPCLFTVQQPRNGKAFDKEYPQVVQSTSAIFEIMDGTIQVTRHPNLKDGVANTFALERP